MNRRGFLGMLAGAMLATASVTRLGRTAIECLRDQREQIIELIEARMRASMESMSNAIAYNVFNSPSERQHPQYLDDAQQDDGNPQPRRTWWSGGQDRDDERGDSEYTEYG